MSESETSVIEHLIEVENQASSITADAQKQAADKINSAKAEADKAYLEQFNAAVAELDKSFKNESEKISAKVSQEVDSYKEKLSKTPQDKTAFNRLLDNLLFKNQADAS